MTSVIIVKKGLADAERQSAVRSARNINSGRERPGFAARSPPILGIFRNSEYPDNQVFTSRAQARREIFEYIELYYNNQRLHSALGYHSPSEYETKFVQVIDIETNRAKGPDAATEDRALRGRTSSAAVALQTAGAAAYVRPTGPGPAPRSVIDACLICREL
jgi:Integrase core domain